MHVAELRILKHIMNNPSLIVTFAEDAFVSTAAKDTYRAMAESLERFKALTPRGVSTIMGSTYPVELDFALDSKDIMADTVALDNHRKLSYITDLAFRLSSISADEVPYIDMNQLMEPYRGLNDGADTDIESGVRALDMQMSFRGSEHYKPMGTGIHALDEAIEGWSGQFSMILGDGGVGKTAFILGQAVKLAKEGFRVGVYSYEMGKIPIISRIISSVAQVPERRIKRGMMTPQEATRVRQAMEDVKKLPLFVHADRPDIDKMIAHAVQHRLDVIFIDYLQLIRAMDRQASAPDAIEEVLTKLAQLPSRGISVVCIAHMKRGTEPPEQRIYQSSRAPHFVDVGILLTAGTVQEGDGVHERIIYVSTWKNRYGRMLSGDGAPVIYRGDTLTYDLDSERATAVVAHHNLVSWADYFGVSATDETDDHETPAMEDDVLQPTAVALPDVRTDDGWDSLFEE